MKFCLVQEKTVCGVTLKASLEISNSTVRFVTHITETSHELKFGKWLQIIMNSIKKVIFFPPKKVYKINIMTGEEKLVSIFIFQEISLKLPGLLDFSDTWDFYF